MMKRRYAAFAIMLVATLLVRLSLPVVAEMVNEATLIREYKCEATTMLGADGAIACALTKDKVHGAGETPEDVKTTSSQKKIYTYGDARAEIALTISKGEVTEEEWAEVMQWLDFSIAAADIDASRLDAEELAHELLNAISSAQLRARPNAAEDALFDAATLSIDSINAWTPYYEELSRGSRSDDVARLQQRLIDLGYLDDKADGQFGKKTHDAVMAAQAELLEREMAVYAPKPTPAPEPTATPEATNDPVVMGNPAMTGDSAPTDEPIVTPEPTPEPYVPETEVNGVAGQIFQIRLYSDEFPIVVPDISAASSTLVARMQKKLIELGYLAGAADGHFGPNTRRGVLLFQHYNGLDETGVADEAVQRLIYSPNAKAPAHPLLSSGSSGDEVKKLQNLLIRMGFITGAADGDYGSTTKTGVERVQKYLREKEIERLLARYATPASRVVPAPGTSAAIDAAPTPEPTLPPGVAPSTEVTGVADPLFLDELYSPDIEWIPPTLKNGDAGIDVERLQRRLYHLEYLYSQPDGNFGNGTETALRAFQERNALSIDGVAGQSTLEVIFSDSARKALKPYVLKVSTSKQRVYAYAPDANEEYTKLARTMICSTGLSSTPTPKGTYQSSTGPGARWHYFKKFSCWAQYAYYIQGDIMFHSVLYGTKGGAVTSSSVHNLGSKASHGCVRLKVEDAKWIYQNCPKNTKVIVY